MKKYEKREREAFKRLSCFIPLLDSYESVYPEQEIEQNDHLAQKDLNTLKLIKESFKDTDIEKYTEVILDTEKSIAEKDMLYEEELIKVLYARDRLYLLSMTRSTGEKDMPKPLLASFYEGRRASLITALDKNIRTFCTTEFNRVRMQAFRTRKKLQLYLETIEENLQILKEEENDRKKDQNGKH